MAAPDPHSRLDVIRGTLNVGLSLSAAGGRFVLVWALARLMAPAELGSFGLMSASVALGVYLVGLDLQTVVGREVAGAAPEEVVVLMRDQFLLHAASYLFLLPVLLLLFPAGFLPWNLLWWFYPLLVAEHLGTELQRLLVFLGRPLLAKGVLFARNSAWALILLPWLWRTHDGRGLTYVWAGWLMGSGSSIVMALVALRRLPWRRALGKPDLAWMMHALRAIPFLFATTLLQRAFFSIDRFVLQNRMGEAAVGVYTFFFSIANMLLIIVDSGIVQTTGVRLFAAQGRGDVDQVRKLERRLLWGGAFVVASTAVLLGGCAGWMAALTGKAVYSRGLPTFWVLLLAMAVFVMGHLARVVLLARRADRKPLWSYVLAVPVAFVAHLALVPRLSHLGTAYAMLIGAVVVTGTNWYWVRQGET